VYGARGMGARERLSTESGGGGRNGTSLDGTGQSGDAPIDERKQKSTKE